MNIQAPFETIRVVAFDADDTLWDCQTHFDHVTREMCRVLSTWSDYDEAWQQLIATERKNLPITGYGCKAYLLSVIETAIRVSKREISAADIDYLLRLGNDLLNMPVPPLPEVHDTLSALRSHIDRDNLPLQLAVFTKGELKDQENKLKRSGLDPFFDWLEITSDKQEQNYLTFCKNMGCQPDQLLMVGNSFRSDIMPALAVGAAALYIPYHVQWEIEKADEFDHPRLRRLQHFSEVLDYLVLK